VDNEANMRHMGTELESRKKLINYSHKKLGNCFLEDEHDFYTVHPSSIKEDEYSKLLHFTQTGEKHCNIIEVDNFCFNNSILGTDIWTLFFDGSKS
jgi:hypothetical protein